MENYNLMDILHQSFIHITIIKAKGAGYEYGRGLLKASKETMLIWIISYQLMSSYSYEMISNNFFIWGS